MGIVQGQTPLHDIVKTEQAFSKMAEEKTTREAFMAFIADDGLLFRPGAVNGKKWMLEHPVPPSDKKPLLAWQPSFAGMAASGDMGFTTGPWEFKGDIKDAKPSGYGHFVTVWKKQPDGTWKWTVDIGISHPQSGGPQKLWHPKAQKVGTPIDDVVDLKAEFQYLLDKDKKFAEVAEKEGLFHAFFSYAAPDIRLYRAGSLPYIGIQAAGNVFISTKGRFTWQPIGADISRSRDLGYTHGTYQITDDTQKVVESGSYVCIWRAEPGRALRVVLDMTNAH
jgi:Domain of unknown function (DUF4440)